MVGRRAVWLPLILALACHAAETVAGRWEGAVRIPGAEMRVVVDLAQDSAGTWTGSATVPGYDVKGAPLADLAVNGSDVAFTIKALGEPKFQGRLTAAGELSGDCRQAGNTAPFQLAKTGPPQVEPPRRNTPVRKELVGEWRGEMQFVGRPIRVALKLSNQAGGMGAAQFVLDGQRHTELPLDRVDQEADTLTVESSETGIGFEGWFRSGAISGTFRQGPFEAPLVLRQAGR